MTQINIPFKKEFKDVILSGQKNMTSRNKRYGEIGDTFEAFGKIFILTSIYRRTLGDVKSNFWYSEGCSSPEDFERIWKEINPRKGFQPNQTIWLHKWKEV